MTTHTLDYVRPDADAGRRPTMHNRWHPHIPPALSIESGDTVVFDTQDAIDGQSEFGMSIEDFLELDFGRVHALTGPVFVHDAEPGDLLAVEIVSIDTADHSFTATLPGRGLLPDVIGGPLLAHWELAVGWATSPEIPGVRIPAAPFMGTPSD